MKIFLVGVSCIGKTTIGALLAKQLDYNFFDFDNEIEKFFGTSIEKMQSKYPVSQSFRKHASKALKKLLSKKQSKRSVIAMPPSGLMDHYLRIIQKTKSIIVVLKDSPENILKRISFYDIDSRPMEKNLTEEEKDKYLTEIKKDIEYFGITYSNANFAVDITGLGPVESASKVKEALTQYKKISNHG